MRRMLRPAPPASRANTLVSSSQSSCRICARSVDASSAMASSAASGTPSDDADAEKSADRRLLRGERGMKPSQIAASDSRSRSESRGRRHRCLQLARKPAPNDTRGDAQCRGGEDTPAHRERPIERALWPDCANREASLIRDGPGSVDGRGSATPATCCSARRRTGRPSTTPGGPRSAEAARSRRRASRSSRSRATGPTATASTGTSRATPTPATAPRRPARLRPLADVDVGQRGGRRARRVAARAQRSQTAEQKVGFYGLDVYSLWDSMHAVIGYLETIDPALAGARAARLPLLRAVRRGRAGVRAGDGAGADVVRGRGGRPARELRRKAPRFTRRRPRGILRRRAERAGRAERGALLPDDGARRPGVVERARPAHGRDAGAAHAAPRARREGDRLGAQHAHRRRPVHRHGATTAWSTSASSCASGTATTASCSSASARTAAR